MIAYGFPDLDLEPELDLALRIGAETLEILPDWSRLPDPVELRRRTGERGLAIHSAHGCWGARTIGASRVDLGSLDSETHRESLDDLRRCADWLLEAGGRVLVIHPGGLSAPEELEKRRDSLARGLVALADHASGCDLLVCVENMPPGVFPGSQMADLHQLVSDLDRPQVALALDTGHAHLSAELASETLAAGARLRTTHVHDNGGSRDTHDAPGYGTIDWRGWGLALDEIGYRGPIVLECVRQLRDEPERFLPQIIAPLLASTLPAEPGNPYRS
jgi:sugar phosphate isomerase/epimerase